LYNCLSTIKWKALKKGDEEIGDIAGLVARFYRTALNNGRQFTTVSDELDNIRAYVEIQKKMHDDGFSVEYRIDEEGLGYTMPNFLLQPVVENAIEHGIDYVEEGTRGKIMIEFVHENGCLLFSIYNNGPLIAVEDIDTLLHTQGHGYGLNNIEERIHLYYGEDYGISVRTTEERYTCFTIRIGDSVECEISPE
jgi:two-component system sensor histidine kinase YesM